jgi:hypothetical protein
MYELISVHICAFVGTNILHIYSINARIIAHINLFCVIYVFYLPVYMLKILIFEAHM